MKDKLMELFQNKVKLEVHQIKEDNNVYIQSLSPIARSLGIDFNNDITKLYDSLVQKLEVQTGCRLSWNSYQNIESQDFIFEIKPPIRLLKYSSTYIMDVYDSTFPTNIFGNIKSKYKKYTGEWIPNEIKGTAIRAGGSCQNFINTKSAHIRATHLKYGLEFGEIFTELNEPEYRYLIDMISDYRTIECKKLLLNHIKESAKALKNKEFNDK